MYALNGDCIRVWLIRSVQLLFSGEVNAFYKKSQPIQAHLVLLCQAWHLTRWFDTLTHGLYSAVTDFRGMVNWSFFVLLKQLKKIVLICVVCFICEKPSIYFVKASTSKLSRYTLHAGLGEAVVIHELYGMTLKPLLAEIMLLLPLLYNPWGQ